LGFLLMILAASLVYVGCPDIGRGGGYALQPPPAVTDLTLSNNVSLGLNVSWDPVVMAGAAIVYEVKYGITDIEADAVPYSGYITSTHVTIRNLDEGTVYYVWVRAGNETGFGPSVMESQKVLLYIPPIEGTVPIEAPSLGGEAAYEVGSPAQDGSDYGNTVLQEWLIRSNSNKGTDLLSGVVMVQWNPVEGATSYEIFVAQGGSGANAMIPSVPTEPTATTTGTSYFHRGIKVEDARNHYVIWVRGINASGKGPLSEPWAGRIGTNTSDRTGIQTGSDFTGMIERADYPKRLTATVTGEGEVYLSWDRSDRASWYEVYYAESLGDVRVMTGGSNSQEILGEKWQEGGWAQNNLRLVPYQKLDFENNRLHSHAIPWNDKAGVPGTPGQLFKVHGCETTITGLDPDMNYFFVVRSLNHNGERGYNRFPDGTEGLAPTLTWRTLSAPANVQVSPVSPGGGGMLKVNWDPVAGATGYRIYYSKFPTPAANLPSLAISGGTTTTGTLVRLDENHQYYVWMAATTATELGPFSDMASGVPNFKDGTETVITAKTAVWGAQLRNPLYIEVNDDDPRIALGYVLEQTGEQFFDEVIIFAANLRVRNCATEGSNTHRCTKSGPHLHFNGNVQHILENRDKYIRPLQEAGIKVLLGTLPDHDNLTYHSFGPWPFEEVYPWATEGNPGVAYHSHWWTGNPGEYPLGNEAVINAFVEELAGEIEKYGLDGFDIDDEWASTGTNASTRGLSVNRLVYGGTTVQNEARDRQMAENIANLLYRARIRLDAGTPPEATKKIISIFDYGSPGAILGTSGAKFGPAGNKMDINPNIWNYVTYSLYSMYGSSRTSSFAGIPRMQYSPFAVGFHNLSGPTSYGTYTDAGNDPWGYVCFYGLTSIASRGGDNSGQLNLINRYAPRFFGQNVVYMGPDYPRDWTKW
jgi:hypothetical protein